MTVEGIGSVARKLHPVQVYYTNGRDLQTLGHFFFKSFFYFYFLCVCKERIAKAHGSQCGFCTPGIVMSMYTLLRNKPRPEMSDVEEAFHGSDSDDSSSLKVYSGTKQCDWLCLCCCSGNLCRCTGYRPILEGYKTFTVVRLKLLQILYCRKAKKKIIHWNTCRLLSAVPSQEGGCCGGRDRDNGCCMTNGKEVENGHTDNDVMSLANLCQVISCGSLKSLYLPR